MHRVDGTCARCGHEPPSLYGGGITLWMDRAPRRVAGLDPSRTRPLDTNPPSFLVPLPHPNEHVVLEAEGEDFERALAAERLVRIDVGVCPACKHACDAATLLQPPSAKARGAGWFGLMGLGVGLFFAGVPPIFGGVVVAVGLTGGLLTRRARTPERAPPSGRGLRLRDAFRCTHCGALDPKPLAPPARARCPSCGEVELELTLTVGM